METQPQTNPEEIIEGEIIEEQAPSRFKKAMGWVKENAVPIGTAVAATAITVVFKVLENQRENRKEAFVYEAINEQRAEYSDAVEAYKNSLGDDPLAELNELGNETPSEETEEVIN